MGLSIHTNLLYLKQLQYLCKEKENRTRDIKEISRVF